MGRFVARLLAASVLGVSLAASQAGLALASQDSSATAARPASAATALTGAAFSARGASRSTSASPSSGASSKPAGMASSGSSLAVIEGEAAAAYNAKPAARTAGSASARTADSTPPSITTTSLPDATQGAYYDEYVDASGGTTPYTWSVSSGSLPAGLTLDPSGGDIYGVPSGTGTSTFTVEVTDSSIPTALTATQVFTVTVDPSTLTVSSAEPPDVTKGTYYYYYLNPIGGVQPYTFSVISGSLPAGLSLDPSAGDIFGTPTGTGTSSFAVQITDSSTPAPQSVTQVYTLTVDAPAPLQITNATLAAGSVGGSYFQFVNVTGGVQPYAFSVSSGSLPDGLTLDPSEGEISGVPTVAGTSSFTVQVTDSDTPTPVTVTAAYMLTVTTPAPLAFTTPSLPGATQGSDYDETLTASGGNTPYTWSVSSGSLPDGLTLFADGELFGTPTGTGTSTFTVEITDSTSPTAVTATKSYTLAVAGAPQLAITTATLGAGSVGGSYYEELSATGGLPLTRGRCRRGRCRPGCRSAQAASCPGCQRAREPRRSPSR